MSEYRTIKATTLERPGYQLMVVGSNNTYQLAQKDFGFDENSEGVVAPVIKEYMTTIGAQSNVFQPKNSIMKNVLVTGDEKYYLLIQAFEFSDKNFHFRFSKLHTGGVPYLTDYDAEQSIGIEMVEDEWVLGEEDLNYATVRRVLFLIDVSTGKPASDLLQYSRSSKNFKHELFESYDTKNHILTLNTNKVFGGKYHKQ